MTRRDPTCRTSLRRKTDRRSLRSLDEAITQVDRTLDDVQAGRVPASEALWRELAGVIDALDQRIATRYPETVRKVDELLDATLEPMLDVLVTGGPMEDLNHA